MKARHGTVTLLACVFFLLVPSRVAAKDQWLNIRSKNFNVVTNADERSTRQLALKLEQFRAVFVQLFNIKNESPVPITVIVFKSDAAFKPFKPLYNGKPGNFAGYFQRGEDENIIALNINGNEQRPMAVIFHEYTHLLTAYTPKEWPLWLKEGLAELYSTFEVNKNEVTLGAPVADHVFFLRAQKFTPLQRLFQVERNSPDYNEGNKQGVFYAESWALAHYLVYGNNGARKPELIKFVQLVNSGSTVEKAFTEAFKSDYATLEKELRRYIGNDKYGITVYTMTNVEGEKEMIARPLSDAEVQFYLGDLLLHTNRIDEAETFFKQAEALDPNLPGPHEGLGFVATRRQKYSDAEKEFKEASALGSRNHLARFYYAQSMVYEGSASLGSNPELGKRIVEELRGSIKLMPGFAPAQHLLGFTLMVIGDDLKEAARATSIALQLEPQNKQFSLTMAQIQIRAGNYDAAKRTLAPLLQGADDDPGIRPAAESMMNMIDSFTRRSADVVETSPPTSQNSPREDGPRPTLKRRDQLTATKPETSSAVDDNLPQVAGAESLTGELAAIECGNGTMVLVFKTTEKLLRFAVSDPVNLQFLSRNPELASHIGCGPVNLRATIRFKPTVGKSRFAGDAIAVELLSQ